MRSIMIDLETLSTRADASILSIGAVKFDQGSGEIDDNAFYASISLASNTGRHISDDTLTWWMGQSEEARRVFSEEKITLREALTNLQDWTGNNTHEIWSNGADFDIPILNHAFATHGLEQPWCFWKQRCYRTMKNLPFASKMAAQTTFVKHNALGDAYAQAAHLIKIWEEMKCRLI